MTKEKKTLTKKSSSTMKRRGKISQVRSGIGLMSLDTSTPSTSSHSKLPSILPPITTTVELSTAEGNSITQSFLTSRTARVLLAGAGFLADAVSIY